MIKDLEHWENVDLTGFKETYRRVAGFSKLKDDGKNWAELYRGSGRPTGYIAEEPVYMNTGEIAPGWTYVGEMTYTDFDEWFEAEEKGYIGY